MTVRRVGTLTTALFGLPIGARVGIRGPFGRGFPEAHDVATLYVAGGCGLAPLAAAIDDQLRRRRDHTPVGILYGARDVPSRIHTTALAAWSCAPDVHLIECVEIAAPGWRGRTGTISAYVDEAARVTGAQRAAICGPPAMLAPIAYRLRHLGLEAAAIHLALERQMRCGTGECGHCYLNDRYVCRDGPVFSLAELEALPDAFGDPADTWNSGCL